MTPHGIDHLELFTGEPARLTAYLRDGLGFAEHADVPFPAEDRTSVLLTQGQIELVVSAPRQPGRAAAFVARHGEGVADVALRVADAAAAFDSAVARGARPVREPITFGQTVIGVVGGPGDIVHSLVERPGREPSKAGPLRLVDHVAMCLPAGMLAPSTRFYRDVFGFDTIFEEKIEIGDQGMDSKVVQSPSGGITFTLIEPDIARAPGQIDAFLDRHGGAGVQHVALMTEDIVSSVAELEARDVEFLTAPLRYYDTLAARVTTMTDRIQVLRERNVLVDRDHWGVLLQIFTKPVHPSGAFFFELIERRQARTFGSGNVRALYEAVEQERRASLAASP
ncbi:4-hydroxyphenylpyruvate dioxygenase [Nonomuraea africana]|uniref:4-hydroxymandelate synthase n=1 Tax=Nonomuraea africana TaxID=46171 RepID=A0ABR9KEQ2_9ACTN|nr:4-hydroxyphenylpyruvate dioxygenase [Nonomuraea africana]MBE1560482.1 4-hydroxymandelate synthase [Nonomuraea africana]